MKLKKLLLESISLYQKYISSLTKRSCMFYPTCSEYAKLAIEKYGVLKGVFLASRRILRCHPWATPRVDQLP